MIDQGGVKIDGEKVSDRALNIAKGVTVVAQVGKRKFARVTLRKLGFLRGFEIFCKKA